MTWPLLHLMAISLLRTIHEAWHAGMLVSTHAFLILLILLYVLFSHNRDYIHERMLYNHYSSQNIYLRKMSHCATTVASHRELQWCTCYIQQERPASTPNRNILNAHATAKVKTWPLIIMWNCTASTWIYCNFTVHKVHYGPTNTL
jgi:hypothetical protein